MSTGEAVALQLQRAQALCDLRRHAQAASILWQVLAVDPTNAAAGCLLARAEFGRDDPDAALLAAQRVVGCTPEGGRPHRLAAIALGRLRRYDEALVHARESVRLDPETAAAHQVLAQTLLSSGGGLAPARQAVHTAQRLAPQDASVHVLASQVEAAARNFNAAQTAIERALAIDPQNSAAHNELARLRLRRRGRTLTPDALAGVAAGFASAARANPDSAVGRRNLELVVRVFFSRVAYLIFLDTVLRSHVSAGSTTWRLIPAFTLAIPLWFAVRFLHSLSASLRTHLLRQVHTDRQLLIAAMLEIAAAGCIITAAATPQDTGAALAGLAALLALVGRVMLYRQVRAHSAPRDDRTARPLLGTPVLWLVLATLLIIAIIAFASIIVSRQLAPVALVAGMLAAAIAILTSRDILRRRSARSPAHNRQG